ncbi:MAG: hypothetical protein ACRDOU_18885 [Streptosporangiaceae bacterium]
MTRFPELTLLITELTDNAGHSAEVIIAAINQILHGHVTSR